MLTLPSPATGGPSTVDAGAAVTKAAVLTQAPPHNPITSVLSADADADALLDSEESLSGNTAG